jgi:hypothetical protein
MYLSKESRNIGIGAMERCLYSKERRSLGENSLIPIFLRHNLSAAQLLLSYSP